MQKPDVPAEFKGPFEEWLQANPMLGYVIGGVAILIIVTIGYYLIDFFRKWITEDPDNDPAQKLNELEQLKSTSYMTDEEKRRLNATADIGKLSPTGPLDPELAEFRKIKQMRTSNESTSDKPTFTETDDQEDR